MEIIYDNIVSGNIVHGSYEYFIQSKRGSGEKSKFCEDGLFISDDYLMVVDGVTDKSGKLFDGKKGGAVAKNIVISAFEKMPKSATKSQVLELINNEYRKFYEKCALSDEYNLDFKIKPEFRPSAALIWYSFDRNELCAVGDCKARVQVDGKEIELNNVEKLIDYLNSNLRVLVIEKLGLSETKILENDLGRKYIEPLLLMQSDFQNNPSAPIGLQYWCIDGFDVPEDKISSWKFDSTPEIIELSSDGYESFPKESDVICYETEHKEFIKIDPLRIKSPSTKGLEKDNISFDDRCVLVFKSKLV